MSDIAIWSFGLSAKSTARKEKPGTRVSTDRCRAEVARKYKTIESVIGKPERWGLKSNRAYLGVGPEIDLSEFTASAYFDTLKLKFRFKSRIPANTFRAAVWANPVLTLDSRKGRRNAFVSIRFDGPTLRMTIHDVTLEKLVALQRIFEAMGGLADDAIVLEAHFALDWRSPSKEARERMAFVLPMVVNVADLDLHGQGTPRQQPANGALNHSGTLHLRISKRMPKEFETADDVRPKFYHYSPMYTLPGTCYFGPRYGRTDKLRIYHKTEDAAGRSVNEDKQVTRHERVFRGASLKNLGIETLSGLLSFNARKLARSFSYEIASVPAEEGQLQTIRLYKVQKLMKTGVFAVRESEGGPRRGRSRGRKATLALRPMNKRSNNAWLAFAKRWQSDVRATAA